MKTFSRKKIYFEKENYLRKETYHKLNWNPGKFPLVKEFGC